MRLTDVYLLGALLKTLADGGEVPPELLTACRRAVGREYAILDARRERLAALRPRPTQLSRGGEGEGERGMDEAE